MGRWNVAWEVGKVWKRRVRYGKAESGMGRWSVVWNGLLWILLIFFIFFSVNYCIFMIKYYFSRV